MSKRFAWVAIRRVMGGLVLLLTVAMLLPLFWAVYYKTPDWKAFVWSIALSGLLGTWLWVRNPGDQDLRTRDAFIVVSGGWVVACLVGALPFVLSGILPNPIDAIFESMSGFTTTGATCMPVVEVNAKGVLFWRSTLHWLGGMGIIVAFLALLPGTGRRGEALFQAEVPGMEVERLTPRLRQTASSLWKIYSSITGIMIVVLLLFGMSVYEALLHTFGTVATGGFSNRALSAGAYGPGIQMVLLIFMFLSGANFGLYYAAVRGRRISEVTKDAEFRVYTGIVVLATVIIAVNLLGVYKPAEALRHSGFQVVSVMTTTGFSTVDFDKWPDLSRAMLVFLMFVGGCSGSTAGGIKVVRFMVAAKASMRELASMIHTRAILPVRIGDRVISENTIRTVLVFFALYLSSALVATFYMLFVGLDLASAVSAVACTIGNVGPGLGSVGPTLSFALVPAGGKAVLTFLMLIGRLEILTVFVTLSPAFWRK